MHCHLPEKRIASLALAPANRLDRVRSPNLSVPGKQVRGPDDVTIPGTGVNQVCPRRATDQAQKRLAEVPSSCSPPAQIPWPACQQNELPSHRLVAGPHDDLAGVSRASPSTPFAHLVPDRHANLQHHSSGASSCSLERYLVDNIKYFRFRWCHSLARDDHENDGASVAYVCRRRAIRPHAAR
jgi:hypothetical protein